MTRDRLRLHIHLDSDQTKIVDIDRYKHQHYLELDVRYYVGGTWKNTNEDGVVIATNFVGCLDDVLFNAFHPISEVKRKKSGYEMIGNVSFNCPALEYIPITFTSNMAFLRIPTHPKDRNSVSFAFKTYDSEGILLYCDGPISVYLYMLDGKLNFELSDSIGSKEAITLNSDVFVRKELNDGTWHTVRASVDTKFMSFEIDDYDGVNTTQHTVKLLAYGQTLDFENVTYVGGGTYYREMYGFVGCMLDLRVNDETIDLKSLAKPAGIISRSVTKGQCTMRSYCHPTPCRYQSRCIQKLNNFTCKCKKFYDGRYCQVPLFQATCQGYKELGMTQDAHCTVDPDNIGPLPEARVLCNMTAGEDAVTVINNTHSGTMKVRDANRFLSFRKSWAHLIKYAMSYNNLRALVDKSDHCRQYVQFNCINTTFLSKPPNGRYGAVWFSTDGRYRYYWGGAKSTGATCACARKGSCYDRSKVCNCDTGDAVWRQDAGTYTTLYG